MGGNNSPADISFDLFDALGLPPTTKLGKRVTITPDDVKKAWRKVSLHLHPDKRSQNLPHIPPFPTYEQARLAKDHLLVENTKFVTFTAEESIRKAIRHGRARFRSTWNPDAKPGTKAVTEPIPGFGILDRHPPLSPEQQRPPPSVDADLADSFDESHRAEPARPQSPLRSCAGIGLPLLDPEQLQMYTGPLAIMVGDTLRPNGYRYAVQGSVVRGVLYLHRMEHLNVCGELIPLLPDPQGSWPLVRFEEVRLVGPFVFYHSNQHRLRDRIVHFLSLKKHEGKKANVDRMQKDDITKKVGDNLK